MPNGGIVKEVETDAMFARVKQFVEVQAPLGYRWIQVHASTSCSSGSPLKHFGTGGVSEIDVAWEGIMKAVPKYLTLFSVLRLCGSRQVVTQCCADERIIQMHCLSI